MKNRMLRIADWTITPGPREKDQGPWSAELYVEEVLAEAFRSALAEGAMLTIDLDGVAGYIPSFIEEVFGGLSRLHGSAAVESHLAIISDDDPFNFEEAWEHVRNPKPAKRRNR